MSKAREMLESLGSDSVDEGRFTSLWDKWGSAEEDYAQDVFDAFEQMFDPAGFRVIPEKKMAVFAFEDVGSPMELFGGGLLVMPKRKEDKVTLFGYAIDLDEMADLDRRDIVDRIARSKNWESEDMHADNASASRAASKLDSLVKKSFERG